ncbi:FkbM family methyltransferase [Azotobacter beijerinckii]|uniref:Methyltransferase, FkbM family n=1 Tax=Azotobacter beijerinckii TaxID=170623 RepID=A0A1I4DE41_9GAMM|nr:FkbM family methyltransferase [Azotobacter beijerinckii]SFB35215.1 methyltransferase, FkbM family [Azotobacter beijerinckii]SFK91199.1 methyltransferase, FkbM family [Azotobacter beijerinckii]
MTETESTDLIFDVGAHKGEDCDFYFKLGYRVVAVEANPALAEHLKERFSEEINDGSLILLNKAIGDTEGTTSFFINKKRSVWGTTDPHWVKRNKARGAESEEIKVESTLLSNIINAYGCPHYLKIDIEGADMACVNGLKALKQRPKYISLESTMTSWLDLLNELNTLEKLGYTKFKLVNQKKHEDGKFRNRNGELISHSFEEGASGPFGDDLEGPWLTKRQAIRAYMPIFIRYKTVGVDSLPLKTIKRIPFLHHAYRTLCFDSWYDTHAMRE